MKLNINEKWQFPSYFPWVWGTKYGKKREKSDCSKWVSEKFPHPVRELLFAAKHTSWTWLMECKILDEYFSLKKKKKFEIFYALGVFSWGRSVKKFWCFYVNKMLSSILRKNSQNTSSYRFFLLQKLNALRNVLSKSFFLLAFCFFLIEMFTKVFKLPLFVGEKATCFVLRFFLQIFQFRWTLYFSKRFCCSLN